MMKINSLLFMLLFTSCATAGWQERKVSFKNQTWRICTREVDGGQYHLKGFCYWQREVKVRRFLPNLTRRVLKTCMFTDETCLLKFQLAGKNIR